MKRKQYNSPLVEVESIDLERSILLDSPVVPVPPHPTPAVRGNVDPNAPVSF